MRLEVPRYGTHRKRYTELYAGFLGSRKSMYACVFFLGPQRADQKWYRKDRSCIIFLATVSDNDTVGTTRGHSPGLVDGELEACIIFLVFVSVIRATL